MWRSELKMGDRGAKNGGCYICLMNGNAMAYLCKTVSCMLQYNRVQTIVCIDSNNCFSVCQNLSYNILSWLITWVIIIMSMMLWLFSLCWFSIFRRQSQVFLILIILLIVFITIYIYFVYYIYNSNYYL